MDDEDFLMRQIKSFAQGFGMVLGKKGQVKTEVIYDQKQNQNGKNYTDLEDLLLHHKYEAAIKYVYAQKFNLSNEEYVKLGEWLINKLEKYSDTNADQLLEFKNNLQKVERKSNLH
ncbi:hypothetical protein [Companilactobacillus alimentarius]|uniref:hypothetical protein n=1 Tax=Companilactobacillus alimentarius TaxID=1602 RepID=UPI0028BBFCC1|nr:hypothetical protein [Companilactobacillus alimentarius]MDT6951420.1 hypothetical protein [Companilactobacillus alimentarius]